MQGWVAVKKPIEIVLTEKNIRLIEKKIDKSGECWIWIGKKNTLGYGQYRAFAYDGSSRTYMAHRAVYFIHKGRIPNGKILDHLCHTPACVNPDHLRPATHTQNMRNRAGAARHSGTGVRGVHHDKVRGRYVARVQGRRVGNYKTLGEAEAAATAAREIAFAESETT